MVALLLALSFARKSTATVTAKDLYHAFTRVEDAWALPNHYAVAFRVKDPKGDIGRYWESIGANVVYMSGHKGSSLDVVARHQVHVKHLQDAGMLHGGAPLFQQPDSRGRPSGAPLQYGTMLMAFKGAVAHTCPDIPLPGLGLHILRSLGASWSKWAGNADTDTQFHGMWRSEAYRIYFRWPADYRLLTTQRMLQ